MKAILLIKASSIPAGSHWITVHPNDGPGHPLLIQPQKDGSAKVIGGAGGALNHLRLRQVKSKEEYKQEAAQRQKARKEVRKQQIARDKETGVHEAKKQAKADVALQKREAERQVIREVGKAAGWSEKDMTFPADQYSHLSPEAQDKLKKEHHANLLRKAKDVIKQSQQRLIEDPEARMNAGIGEIAMDSKSPDAVSVSDLAPAPKSTGGGYAPQWGERAAKQGLTKEALKQEAQDVKLQGLSDEERAAKLAKGDAPDLIKAELEGIKSPAAPDADAHLMDAKQALELVKAGKRLAIINKAAKQARAEIDQSVEPKAYILEATSADVDKKVADDIANDLKTANTVSFLGAVDRIAGGDATETLGSHISAGAYNGLNAISAAVSGQPMMDRSVVDVLGIAGASQVLARRIQSDLSPEERKQIAAGIEDYHTNHAPEAASESVKKAEDLLSAAEAIEVPETASTGDELEHAQVLNNARRNAVGDAQRLMGQTMGELEAGAAMVMAMKSKPADTVETSMGRIPVESAIQQVRAIGLDKADYSITRQGGETFLTVHASGLDKLAKPVDRDTAKQVERNISIMRGAQDEDGWMPEGVAKRVDMAEGFQAPAGVAEKFSHPWQPDANKPLADQLRDYIGARTADGDAPADILADVQSSDFHTKSGDPEVYAAALNEVSPLHGSDGKIQRVEALTPQYQTYADQYVNKLGGDRTPLHRQSLQLDDKTAEALHRALSNTPEGKSAYKDVGDLDAKDQQALRSFFQKEVAGHNPKLDEMRGQVAELEKRQPQQFVEDMFGEQTTNPEYADWKSQVDGLKSRISSEELDWSKYIKTLGSRKKAYQAVQDLIRSRVSADFVDAHNKLRPEAPIKVGRQVIRHNLAHLDATDRNAREARLSERAALQASQMNRSGGKFAAGSVLDKMEAAYERKAAFEQSQMGFFSAEEDTGKHEEPLKSDERHTLGHVAEQQLGSMMNVVGRNFKTGQPTKLWNVSMSGKYAPQQRAIKLIEQNKRLVLAAGAGSGKTNIMLGAHAHLASQGKIKRSLMLVPSIVQGQFGGEALRLLEPGKFGVHANPGASQTERIAAYKDPDTHIAVMTHQSFRDDMIHLGAKHAEMTEAKMTDQLQAMTPAERKQWAQGVMDKEGIHFDASFIDEAHETLNRAGKENSSLSNVTEAVGHATPYHVYASGDPVKNDASEIHSMMQKMDPEKYGDRAEFMRRYGGDTMASKQALKREMARYVYSTSVTPDVKASHTTEQVDLTPGQKQDMAALDKHVLAMRRARRAGKVDIEAAKAISPDSFKDAPKAEHQAIAENLQKAMGALKEAAQARIINSHPDNAKVNKAVELVKARPDKQGVIFARNRASVDLYKQAMEKAGKRVVVITGSDTAKEKDAKRKLFNPEKGEAKADILIASDAGAVGMNLQSGQYLIQHDVSHTAKTHSQRNARIHRLGQKQDVELIDLVANHKSEAAARDRLARKYGLKTMMADPIDGLDDTGVAAAIRARGYK